MQGALHGLHHAIEIGAHLTQLILALFQPQAQILVPCDLLQGGIAAADGALDAEAYPQSQPQARGDAHHGDGDHAHDGGVLVRRHRGHGRTGKPLDFL